MADRLRGADAKDIERFWSYVIVADSGCWLWTGTTVWGYGKFQAKRCQWRAHRFSWVLTGRDLPEHPLVIRHECDNKLCVNPSHLISGTQAENIQDKVDRGRQSVGEAVFTSKLSDDQVLAIREEYAATSHLPDGASSYSLAKSFSVDHSIILDVVTGRTWKHVGGPLTKPKPGRRKSSA